MAIFFVKVKTLGARQGSIVKAAAYRSGEKLKRIKTGEVADYTRKQGIVSSGIIAPDHAPAWTSDRAQLWNNAEAAEKRKDARYGREVILALPHELDNQQNSVLVEEYIKQHFIPLGMVADYAIHTPDRESDSRNIHCHILLTDRPLTKDGFASKKNRKWNDKQNIVKWREGWSTILNDAFEAEGIEQNVDHRSYEKQGVDLIAQVHEGKVATGMKRRSKDPDPEAYSEIAAKIEHNNLAREHNQLVQQIEEEKRRRKPDRKRDTTQQDELLESLKRSTTPTTGGSEGDAVQNTAEPVVTPVSSQFGDTPDLAEAEINENIRRRTAKYGAAEPSQFSGGVGDRRRDEQKSSKEERFLYTLARLDRRARFKPRREYYTDARTALEIAIQTGEHIGSKDRKASAVNTYRLALADISKDRNLKNMAYHYHKQTDSALECDRLIREFMKQRGFTHKEINLAMRRASPALYRKSKGEAFKYARKFNAYLKQKNEEDREQKRRQKQTENDIQNRTKKYGQRRRL